MCSDDDKQTLVFGYDETYLKVVIIINRKYNKQDFLLHNQVYNIIRVKEILNWRQKFVKTSKLGKEKVTSFSLQLVLLGSRI